MPAARKKKKPVRRKRGASEKLQIPPFIYELQYERGIPVRELLTLEYDPEVAYAKWYSEEVARSQGIASLEERAQVLLGTAYNMALRPQEFMDETIDLLPEPVEADFGERLVAEMLELAKWAQENRDDIVEAVDWWNFEYPEYGIETVEPETESPDVPVWAKVIGGAGLAAGAYYGGKALFS